jgi:hypothetical protein
MPSDRRVDFLLDELCTTLGICLPCDARESVGSARTADADAFTHAIFSAEGLDPSADRRLYEHVRRIVGRAFAGDAHDA